MQFDVNRDGFTVTISDRASYDKVRDALLRVGVDVKKYLHTYSSDTCYRIATSRALNALGYIKSCGSVESFYEGGGILRFSTQEALSYLSTFNTTNSPKSFMSMPDILSKAALAFKKEPEKSFRKAGITNGDDMLTDEGAKIYLSWMLQKNAGDFLKEVVTPMLQEMKDEK